MALKAFEKSNLIMPDSPVAAFKKSRVAWTAASAPPRMPSPPELNRGKKFRAAACCCVAAQAARETSRHSARPIATIKLAPNRQDQIAKIQQGQL